VKISARRKYWCLLFSFTLGCGGARGPRPDTPSPTPVSLPAPQPTASVAPTSGSRSFKYAPGMVTYRISRSAAIESTGPDSIRHREISTNVTHEALTLDSTDRGTNFTVVVDTFATTTQGLIGPVQPIQLPIRSSGSLTDTTVTINQAESEQCNTISSMLVTDLHNLLVPFPGQLSSGVAWKDSTDIKGCQGGIPTSAHTTRSFVVSGESSYEGRPVLLIVRADTTRAQGEGGLRQHRVSIDATGTGTAVYSLDMTTSRILHLTVDQILNLSLATLTGRFQFKQDSKQDFRIVP
jgi:hypothetical protein